MSPRDKSQGDEATPDESGLDNMTELTAEHAFERVNTQAIIVDRSDLGVLQFSGSTRLDLLHRMSTQDLSALPTGKGTATVLTTDIGRIIDRLRLYASDDSLLAITGENNADNIARYLMRFVFFNDDFHIQDQSQDTFVWAIYGANTANVLGAAGLDVADLALHDWRTGEIDGHSVTVHRTDPLFGDGYFVLGAIADRDAVGQQLQAGGSTLISAETFDAIRIAGGMPRFGRELTSDYIPLEANLWDDVSFTKGCYIGQEIIARMESRGRMAKKLVQLEAEAPLNAGERVTANGKNGGTVTSAATIGATTYALGYIKTSVLEAAEAQLIANDIPLSVTP
jgi:aminomethyltransferase